MFAYESRAMTAERLHLGRRQLGFTQDELGKRLGVTSMTIRRRERDVDNSMPDDPWSRAFLLEQLADLGCPRSILGLPSDLSLRIEGPEARDPSSAEDALREAEARVARSVEAMHRAAETVTRLQSGDLQRED